MDKKELKGLPIWACILLFIVVFFVFMLLYSALIQGFLSLVLGVEARHPGIVGYILQETGMLLTALTSAVIMLRFERRPFSDLGLSVKGHARGLWYGLLIAVLFYLVGFGLSLLLEASRGDQILNAASFEKQGFSYVIKEEELTSEKLLAAITSVDENKETYKQAMSQSNQQDAVVKVADIIEKACK